ncbi:MAG TPA: ribonuclease HII [Chloroflexi bacterium]|nr:ribonuclease HII [Chloroflexota bacterium]
MVKKTVPTTQFEQIWWQRSFDCVAGVDEAGRGAWAGPVTAGAVILPLSRNLENMLTGVRDSKQMSARQRDDMLDKIQQVAVAWAVGWASNVEIDMVGILPATRLAMQRAVACLQPAAQALIIDAVNLPAVALPQESMKFGDQLCLSIAAASICAKVYRDRWMQAADHLYPGYGFARHKGYGTRQHQEAIVELGVCELHRFSFRPMTE